MVGFSVAVYEQGYHYFWGSETVYWNAEFHQKLLWVWIVIGGCFLVIGAMLFAKFLLKIL